MAISVDASVARWTGTPSGTTAITSGSFTPANNSLLVLAVNADSNLGNNITIQVAGGGLSWNPEAESDAGTGAGDGHASLWTAPVTTGASMTISVNRTANSTSPRISAKVYIITGHAASYIGASLSNGNSTTNNLSGSLTATGSGNGGRLFGCGTDWNALGTPTSSDTEDAAHYSSAISVMSAFKAADHAAGSGSQTINFDASGTSAADWNYCLLEILADGGGALAGAISVGFSSAGALGGAGALAGTATVSFSSTGALTGLGALAGSSTISFALAGALGGAGALAGSTALAFTSASSISASGALAGAIAAAFSTTSVLVGAGALAGTSALVFSVSGTLTPPSGSIAGAIATAFASSSTLQGSGALAGTSALVFATTGTLTAPSGAISGAIAAAFSSVSTLRGAGALAGELQVQFASTSALHITVPIAGQMFMQFSSVGLLADGSVVLIDTTRLVSARQPRHLVMATQPENVAIVRPRLN